MLLEKIPIVKQYIKNNNNIKKCEENNLNITKQELMECNLKLIKKSILIRILLSFNII